MRGVGTIGRLRGRSSSGGEWVDDGRLAYIVINSVVPYGYELNNVLAPPAGFSYRGRYKRKWIGPRDPTRLSNRWAMLVLRDYYTSKDVAASRFVPLRYARVGDVKPYGSVARFEYELGEYVALPSEPEQRGAVLAQFNACVEKDIDSLRNVVESRYPNRFRPGDITPLVYLAEDRSKDFQDHEDQGEDARWGNIVDELTRRAPYETFDFLKVIRLTVGRANGVAPIKDGAAILAPDTIYEMDVLQLTPAAGAEAPGRSNHLLHLRADADELRVLRSPFPIVGKYDVYTFRFRTTAADIDAAALLRLERPVPVLAGADEPSTEDKASAPSNAATSKLQTQASAVVNTPRAPDPYAGAIPDIVLPLTIIRSKGARAFAAIRLVVAVAALTVFLAGIGDSSLSTARQIAFVVFVLATAESLPAIARALARSGGAGRGDLGAKGPAAGAPELPPTSNADAGPR
jgi:hypothetical protein